MTKYFSLHGEAPKKRNLDDYNIKTPLTRVELGGTLFFVITPDFTVLPTTEARDIGLIGGEFKDMVAAQTHCRDQLKDIGVYNPDL